MSLAKPRQCGEVTSSGEPCTRSADRTTASGWFGREIAKPCGTGDRTRRGGPGASAVTVEGIRGSRNGSRCVPGGRVVASTHRIAYRVGRPRQRLPKSPSSSAGFLGGGHRKVPANTNLARTRPTRRTDVSGADEGHPGGNLGVGARSAARRKTWVRGAGALDPGTAVLGQRNETRPHENGAPRIHVLQDKTVVGR